MSLVIIQVKSSLCASQNVCLLTLYKRSRMLCNLATHITVPRETLLHMSTIKYYTDTKSAVRIDQMTYIKLSTK